MLKIVNMPEVKTVFLEEIEKLYGETLRRIVEEVYPAESGGPINEKALAGVTAIAEPHDFVCKVEGLLDDAIELCSEVEHSETSGVTGKLEKFTLKDSFALSIDVLDSSQNSALLYEMKQEKYVRIESVQPQLALDDGVPTAANTDGQMELDGDTPEHDGAGEQAAEEAQEERQPEDVAV